MAGWPGIRVAVQHGLNEAVVTSNPFQGELLMAQSIRSATGSEEQGQSRHLLFIWLRLD
ncbi:MAG: hypothetical protein JF606_28190 [Burkholderiales bacterium]|nr:hypothetical protein [Burkholderiales bacterium]